MWFVLSLPVSTPLGKRLTLVYLIGRKSGRHCRQPISYVRDGETLLTPGGGLWKLTSPHTSDPAERTSPSAPRSCALQPRSTACSASWVPRTPWSPPCCSPAQGRRCHYDLERLELAIRHGFCIVGWTSQDAAARETITR